MASLSSGEPGLRSLVYTNPVFGGYFADPFVFRHGSHFYAVGTGARPARENEREFPMLRSDDLVNWEPLGGALVRSDRVERNYWAPEIAEHEGIFYMYYSAGVSDELHELRVATSRHPQGPYFELPGPLLEPSDVPFAIDPSPFQDEDGRWYLFYARDFLDSADGCRPGTAIVVAPLRDMTDLSSNFVVVMRAHHDWQRFQSNRPMYGGVYDWHTLEGPCVVKRSGRYYCLYSGGNWQNASYGIDFAVADSISGPWFDTNNGAGPRVLKTVPGHVIGPGHNSLVTGPSGDRMLAYHAWDPAMTARRLHIDPLTWTPEGPVGHGPTWELRPLS